MVNFASKPKHWLLLTSKAETGTEEEAKVDIEGMDEDARGEGSGGDDGGGLRGTGIVHGNRRKRCVRRISLDLHIPA